MQQKFVNSVGDHLTLLNVYRKWEDNGGSIDWCKKHYLHFRALRQAKDIRSQLCELCGKAGVAITGSRRGSDLVLKALCHGFFMQSARMCSAGGGWLIIGENVLVKPEGS